MRHFPSNFYIILVTADVAEGMPKLTVRRVMFCEAQRHTIQRKSSGVSEQYIATIFRVEIYGNTEYNMKHATCRALLHASVVCPRIVEDFMITVLINANIIPEVTISNIKLKYNQLKTITEHSHVIFSFLTNLR